MKTKTTSPNTSVAKKKRGKVKTKPKRTPRTRQPAELSLEEWQIALRREYGREQPFKLENIGEEPIFSEFLVTNPISGGSYRVAIRGCKPGDNYCSCPDFAVNTLGTCKHIEFTLGKLERKQGGKKALKAGFRASYSEVYLQYGAQRAVRFKPGTDCPQQLIQYASRFFDANGFLKPNAHSTFHNFIKNAPKNGHDLRCYEDTIQFVAHLRDDTQRCKLTDKQFPQGIDSPRFDHLLKVNLYSYQRKGALFAAKAGRCLIADDMGLGKTIQSIAAVEILARTVGVERVLVIAPTSVKHQWKQEIERFADRSVQVIYGSLHKRREAYKTDTFYKITNYDVIHRDGKTIAEWSPDVIILDEAQRIKNWKTRRAQSVKKLQSEYAIVLTGTPLENRLEELHSIVEFVDRFRLGPLFRYLADHQQLDEFGKVVGYHNLSQISKTLEPILLRRTKDEVLKELPERIDQHLFVEMTREQWEHHEDNRMIVAKIVAKWRRLGYLTESDQRKLMIALQNMRMSCNNTFLLDKKTDHGVKPNEAILLLEELLEESNTKAVIFSQWIGTHQLIIDRLEAAKMDYVFYHGMLTIQERNKLIQRFQEDPKCRIFLSTDSGGVGLNLQHASVVLNMDQPWNPAVLEQRVGRVHRLGQRRNVRVVHFISQGTIEHGMLEVLAFKKAVFAGVLDGGEDAVFLGGSRLKKFMETVEKVTTNIPSSMPIRTEEKDDAITAAEIPEEAMLEEAAASQEIESESQKLTASATDVWSELIATGMDLIGQFEQAIQGARKSQTTGKPSKSDMPFSNFLDQDNKTGETYIRLPMPQPETIQTISNALDLLRKMLIR